MEQITTQINSPADFTEKFINRTHHSVFLTGKAGTGKTTLLKKIIDSTYKNTVVVAPTGIAALNAGGVTIHSFFQLPFGSFIPINGQPPYSNGRSQFNTQSTLLKHSRIRKKKQSMFRQLELLIIDEVSMLRADMLDAIDYVLRKYRRNDTPFGGVQVLFIGDLLQLPPVIKTHEKAVLDAYYDGYFFFHSKVIQEQPPLYIELEKIYRQSDDEFIEILNELRNNKISDKSIQLLNNYVNPTFNATEHEGYITLTTHNAKADNINQKAIDAIDGKSIYFDAKITGKFPDHIFPIPQRMELKIGAQVMFIKNDSSFEKLYYNGKIGQIVGLDSKEIRVSFPEEQKTIVVEKYTWENVRYSMDEQSGEIEEKIIGSFEHYPLKLAWAITVHKSQGLTFEKAVLDLSHVFAPGQAYVGLSRLTSLKGLVLTNPIQLNGLKNEQDVVNYAQNKADKKLLSQKLKVGTVLYLQDRMLKTFNWDNLVSKWLSVESQHQTAGPRSEMGKNKVWFENQTAKLLKTLEPTRKFRNQLVKICQPQSMDIDFLYERYEAAYQYFMKILEPIFRELIKKLLVLGSQPKVKQYSETLQELDELLTEIILELKKSRKLIQSLAQNKEISKESIWDEEIRNYKIIKVQVAKDELRREQPSITDIDDSTLIKTAKKKSSKRKKGATYEKTLELFREGNLVEEIARERKLAVSTIYGHIARLVEDEKIEIKEIFPLDKIQNLEEKLGKDTTLSLTEMKERVGDEFSYNEIKIYRSSLIR